MQKIVIMQIYLFICYETFAKPFLRMLQVIYNISEAIGIRLRSWCVRGLHFILRHYRTKTNLNHRKTL